MLLRIEDTDRERSTQSAIDAILEGLSWLGLDWDGDTVYQFARVAAPPRGRRGVARERQRLSLLRQPRGVGGDARAGTRRGPRRGSMTAAGATASPEEAPPGVKPVIRLKAPLTGETVVEDQVQGRVVWQNENLDDLCCCVPTARRPTCWLWWSTTTTWASPTSSAATITSTTLRGRRRSIRRWDGTAPVMAHIPLIHGPDGSKLSKRHGALGIDAYRAMGYLPAAMRNYLVRLGWSHGDQEIFSTEEMIASFDLPHIGRSPARFDFAKLESLNGHYLRHTSDLEILGELERVLPYLADESELAKKLTPAVREQLLSMMGALKERAKTLVELVDGARFIIAQRPLRIDERAQAVLTEEARMLLGELATNLNVLDEWTEKATEEVIRSFVQRTGMKLGSIAQPLRAALTGRTTSPPIFEVLAVLGKDESLARIKDQIAQADEQT